MTFIVVGNSTWLNQQCFKDKKKIKLEVHVECQGTRQNIHFVVSHIYSHNSNYLDICSAVVANRTEPNLSDVFEAFRDLGVNLSELAEFTHEVESIPPPQPIPRYPIPRSSTHIYHAPPSGGQSGAARRSRTGSLSSEDEFDRDHIPPYLPPLPLEKEEEKGKQSCTCTCTCTHMYM